MDAHIFPFFPSGPCTDQSFQTLVRTVACDLLELIIPTHHHYAYFTQFDWLEKKFYTSIHEQESRNYFLPPAPKLHNKCRLKYDFDDKIGIIRNELLLLSIL